MISLLLLAALAEEPVPDSAAPAEAPTDAADPYLWLEEVLGDEALAQVRTWNAGTAEVVEADPRMDVLTAEALEILTSDARIPDVELRGDFFYDHRQDPEHVRGLWRRTPIKAFLAGEPEWDVILDVDALAESEGENWIWHGASCAPESTRCLVDLSPGGTDASVLREFDLSTRAFVEGGFTVPLAKSDVRWIDEDTLLLGTDTGEGSLTESGYPRFVHRWSRGTSLADSPVVWTAEPTDVGVELRTLSHGRDRVAIVGTSPSFFESELALLQGTEATPLPLPRRMSLAGLFRGELMIVLQQAWQYGGDTYGSGELVGFDLDTGAVRRIWTPTERQSLERVAIGKKTLSLSILDDVVGKLVRLRPKGSGWRETLVDLPANGTVSVVAADDGRDDVLVSFESLTVPDTLFHVDARDRLSELASLPAFYDASGITVEQRFATSADGTRVPYFLMGRTDVLAKGPAPTIQYGYGGFLAAILPTYYESAARPQHGAFVGRIWVERGGVLALSNIRGGSEYGPEWHAAALKHDRQRAYDDFFAIGEQLVSSGVTTPEQLGAIGRSNGGLLMGVAFTQRPDLYAAIDCGVPLLDMLRYDKLLAGASWVGEYGDPDIPEDRAVLETYSPYQQVVEGVDYPAILFYTSTRDDRVHPGHARKMAAKLDALDVPFWWFENIEGGHGGVANQEQAAYRLALELLFFHEHLGLPWER